jgi:predicted AAA+ superfamily ATPase
MEVGPFRLSEIASVRRIGLLAPFEQGNGFGRWATLPFWQQLCEYAQTNARIRDEAFEAFADRGGYPLAQRDDIGWEEVAKQLNETVVKRVIQHDLRVGERGRRRDEQLLEEMFRMSARYCGQAPNPTKLAREAQEALGANIGVQRVRKYLEFLDSALLIRAVKPLEIRLKKRKGSDKICLSDHAVRAAWLDEIVPLTAKDLDRKPEQADLAGHVAESVAGYYFASLGIGLAHLPVRTDAPEVDFILTAGDHRVPVEVKYQRRIDPVRDTEGLRRFIEKKVNRAPMGLLVTRDDTAASFPDGIIAVPLKSLLLVR